MRKLAEQFAELQKEITLQSECEKLLAQRREEAKIVHAKAAAVAASAVAAATVPQAAAAPALLGADLLMALGALEPARSGA